MMLCLDCGNSRLKWGCHDGDRWQSRGTVAHAEISQLARLLPPGYDTQFVIGCNVAGEDRARQIESVLARRVAWITATERQCGVTNGYENSVTLGSDRWAALIAARAQNCGAALVVLAGTATTIDVLDQDGHHRGGLILPGIEMMADALMTGTAQLPQASGSYRALPHNTHDAIISGAVHATLGAIQRMRATLPGMVCLLSGGAAEMLMDRVDAPCQHIDTLVLDGLVHIAARRGSDPA